MSGMLVMSLYGVAVLAALLLLYLFEPVHWMWHVLSLIAALAIGLAPLPASWHSPLMDALVGCAFLMLFTWAVCAPLFRKFHRERHA
jgi:hypothetical protein